MNLFEVSNPLLAGHILLTADGENQEEILVISGARPLPCIAFNTQSTTLCMHIVRVGIV